MTFYHISNAISILCGLYRQTSGTAFVDSHDIRTNIDQIHMMMGVCGQDNQLWDDLTAREHLLFYGRIKNMKGKELDNNVQVSSTHIIRDFYLF